MTNQTKDEPIGNEQQQPIQQTILTCALREVHAAENSGRRAWKEFLAALPSDTIVLHRLPGVEDGPDTLYWIYWPDGTCGGGKFNILREDEQTRVIIVEAPGPREEFLPRLPTGTTVT